MRRKMLKNWYVSANGNSIAVLLDRNYERRSDSSLVLLAIISALFSWLFLSASYVRLTTGVLGSLVVIA